jgi:aminoglycoside 3-N-acetyltransferase
MGLILRRLQVWAKTKVPGWLKDRLKRYARKKRLKEIRETQVPVTLAAFELALRDLSLGEGQIVFVHSGADWLRSVEGGPMRVIETLRTIIGPEGTLLMPSFPFDGLAVDFLKTSTFDSRRSPSKMGLLTELFRRIPGVVRSLHPSHPVCAVGFAAEELTESHHHDPRPFGPTSPFARFEAMGGKILMIGVDSTYLTHVHVVEDALGSAFPKSVYLDEPMTVEILGRDDAPLKITTYVHNPAVSRMKSIACFEDEWVRAGLLRRGTIGHIGLRIFDAVALSSVLREWAKQGKTIYG